MKNFFVLVIICVVFMTIFTPNAKIQEVEDISVYSHPEIAEEFRGHVVFERNDLSHILSMHNIKDLTYTELSKVPVEIRNKFIESGWMLYVGNETIDECQKYIDFPINGITMYKEKIVAVEMPTSLLHEFGHYYQYASGNLDCFDDYYNEGQEVMESVSTYAAKNDEEYFATVFDCYIKDSIGINSYITDAIKENIPMTWSFFEDKEAENWLKIIA